MAARGVSWTIVALTGTPGTGKTTTAERLRSRGFAVLDLNRFVDDPRFDEGPDEEAHGAHVIDEAAVSDHLLESLRDELRVAGEVVPSADANVPVFLDSHFAHELAFVDRAVVLRANPEELERRLTTRDWPPSKVDMNVAAERQGVIAAEAHAHREEAAEEGFTIHVVEIDTTSRGIDAVVDAVIEQATAAPANLDIRPIDWRGFGGA